MLEKEINTLGGLLENPDRPFTAVLGGAKVSDKVAIIKSFLSKVDNLLIGGGMAATFLKAQGKGVGTSIVEEDLIETARDLMAQAEANGVNLMLPEDVIITTEIKPGADAIAVKVGVVPADKKIADIGPQAIRDYTEILWRSKTVFWNARWVSSKFRRLPPEPRPWPIPWRKSTQQPSLRRLNSGDDREPWPSG